MRVEYSVVAENGSKNRREISTFRSLELAKEYYHNYFDWYMRRYGNITLYKTFWIGNSFHHSEIILKSN